MKLHLLFGLLVLAQILIAQNFTEVPASQRFDRVSSGSVAFSDVNGDGHEDAIMTGSNIYRDQIAKLYTNDGLGNFTEMMNTPFEGVNGGSVAFSDVNGDGYKDVLITGRKPSQARISKLYTNDGLGNFTEIIGTPFEGVYYSSIAFSDINGDGNEDVLITGIGNSSTEIAKLYTNDGMGNFTEMMNTPFEGVNGGSVAFSDVNGDGYKDVLITGSFTSKLYTNDGLGNFTEMIGTPFEGVSKSSIAFSDVNGDGIEDVLITGLISFAEQSAKLYTNDGLGNFTEVTGTPFVGVSESSIAFSDVNGDGNEDVLITGLNLAGQIAKLYTNDGAGNFTEMIGTPYEGVYKSSIAFSDVNGDGNEDVLITGENGSDERIAKLYTNDGLGNFTQSVMMGTPFDGIWESHIGFSDVNSDGKEDVLITGRNIVGERIAKLYTNDGLGNFTEVRGTPFDGVVGSFAFSDVNNDGSEDVLISGLNGSDEPTSKLYTNDGLGNFTEMMGTPFDGVVGSVAFSDVNGDGSEDVIITGRNGSNERITKLYINEGLGNFTEMAGTPFDGVWAGSVAFSDVTGDGREDVIITGSTEPYEQITKLYTNDGAGNFTEMLNTPFEGVEGGDIAFSDVNGDGHEDILITGANRFFGNWGIEVIAKLYINNGRGNFTEMSTPFYGVWTSSIAFSDVNGDGHEDVLITGSDSYFGYFPTSKLYINDGRGNFTETRGTPFVGVAYGSIAFSDVNGDGKEDVLITGTNTTVRAKPIAKLYINDGVASSTTELDIEFNLDLSLYPNPTKASILDVSFDSGESGFTTVKIYDLHGRLLSQREEFTIMEHPTLSIDITSLTSGSYFIQVENGENSGAASL